MGSNTLKLITQIACMLVPGDVWGSAEDSFVESQGSICLAANVINMWFPSVLINGLPYIQRILLQWFELLVGRCLNISSYIPSNHI